MIRFLLSLFVVLSLFPCQARWATYEDAPVEVEDSDEVTINEDGTGTWISDYRVKILNEAGRNQCGSKTLLYKGGAEKIEVLEASTTYNGKTYKVPKSMIETKPLASSPQGFDQLYQVLISFPHVNPGAQIHLKYKLTTLKPMIKKNSFSKIVFGSEGYLLKHRVKVRSKIPLFEIINDPTEALDVKKTKEKGWEVYEINLKKPLIRFIVDEQNQGEKEEDLLTYFSFSSFKDAHAYGQAFAGKYDETLKQPLPITLEEIRKEAEALSDPVDQINKVTSLISEKIRYMGDWSTIEGGYFPRPLAVIAKSGVADCKEFSSCTAAILNALGFKATVALVHRGAGFLTPKQYRPEDYVNHVIVKAIKDEKTYWIDPTNFVSMADGMFPDISNRPAVVLDPENSKLEMVPEISAEHAKNESEQVLEIQSDALLHTDGTIKQMGEFALVNTGATLKGSEKGFEESMILALTGTDMAINPKMVIPDLNSRIVKDLTFKYSFDQEHAVILTNKGYGLDLNFESVLPYLVKVDDRESAIFVFHPATLSRKIMIKDVSADNLETLNFSLQTPWIELSRACQQTPEGIEVIHKALVKKAFITPDEYRSEAYKEFISKVKKYCRNITMIVVKKKPAS